MGDMMKRLFCILLSCVLIALTVAVFHADSVTTSARAFELYCADNGEVLLSENADEKLPMASTTKIMTTLLCLEAAAKDNKTVAFTEKMTAEGSSMYLQVGERVTLRDLAVGMMMQSGNDAANAAAIAIAGSIEAFADRMNEKAKEIGMAHTHFVTPSGLDDEEHYSCAHDMALLMAYALQNEAFAQITSETSMTVSFVEPSDKKETYPNHNKLLKLYEGCIGGKTGYTDRSGRCLVSAAKRDGVTLIAVTLDDPDDWDDHIGLYTYGFNALCAAQMPKSGGYTVPLVGADADSVTLTCAETASAIVPRDRVKDVHMKVSLPPFVYAPLKEGERVGELAFLLDGEKVACVPLTVSEAVSYNDKKRDFITYIKDLLHWHS